MQLKSDYSRVPGGGRGRVTFQKFRWLLRAMTLCLRLLPHGCLRVLWAWSDAFTGHAGVGLRYCILQNLAASCGENVFVGPSVEIQGWRGLSIGSNVSIHRNCYIDATGGITIGDEVSIAHQTSVLSFEHTWADSALSIRDNPLRFAPVIIDDDVWIGCGCRILAGVRIASRSIVAAGAVVAQDVMSGTIVGGVPARLIKRI